MKTEWNIKIDGRGLTDVEIIEALMESRGIKDYEKFLTPTEDDIIPYDEMLGVEEGCDIVLNTIENGGKFIVHFDVDQDGISSGTIITRYLLNYTNNVSTTINNGKEYMKLYIRLDERQC